MGNESDATVGTKSMASSPQLGDQEIDVLRFIDDHAPVTLRDVIDGYGTPRKLARTTILTVVDRLRRKGFLERKKDKNAQTGVFIYRPTRESQTVMADVVRGFVDKTLGGSLTPFVEYLIDSKGLTDDEAQRLRDMIKD